MNPIYRAISQQYVYQQQYIESFFNRIFKLLNASSFFQFQIFIKFISTTMIHIILGCLLILISFAFIKLYLIPKRTIRWHRKNMDLLGYRVNQLPFSFGTAAFYVRMGQDVKKYGDCIRSMKFIDPSYDILLYNFIGTPAIHILSPDLIKEFYSQERTYSYPKYQPHIAIFRRILNEGIVFAENQNWKQRKKIITEVFNFDLIKSLIPKMVQISNQQFNRFQGENVIKNSKLNAYITKVFTRITSNIVVDSFFGSEVQDQKINGVYLSEFLTQIIYDLGSQCRDKWGFLFGSWIYKVGFTSSHRDLNRRIKQFWEITEGIVKHKIEQIKKSPIKSNGTNLIQNLVKHQKNNNQSEKGQFIYKVKEIVQQFNTFFAAGTDNTSYYLTMITYYLILNPRIMKKLRQQIDEFIKSDQDINYENLKKMTYLQNILRQTTRMYGPAIQLFLRQASEDHQIGGISIPKGTLINVDNVSSHYNPKFYNEPFQFKPQRWEQQRKNISSFALTGFGGGARVCIGKQFAMIQSKIVMIKLLKRYSNFSLPCSEIKMEYQLSYIPQKILTEITIK